MKVSIIIVNWNTGDLLHNCLVSIGEASAMFALREVEVIVVDNASTDGSEECATQQFPFDVYLIENDVNVGFARANNQGIRRARGEYVLLLNPDTELRPGALAALVAFLDAHPPAAAAGPQLLNPDGSLQVSSYPSPTLTGELFRLFHLDALVPYGSYHMSKWSLERPRQVDALLGACLLVRRSVLECVGLLDEDYFMYSEEIDLCHRIRRAGWRLYWIPEARIVHYGGQSTRLVAAQMFQELYRSKLLYFYKNHGRAAATAYKFILATAALVRLLMTPLAVFQKPQERRESITLARRYQRLLRRLPSMQP